jgi:hypothetical protein
MRALAVSLALCGGLTGLPVLAGEAPKEVLEVIERFLKAPNSKQGHKDAEQILKFAADSPDVEVDIDAGMAEGASGGGKKDPGTVLAAYVAGDVREQLKRGNPGDAPEAGLLEAFRVYQGIRKKHPGFRMPGLEAKMGKQVAKRLAEGFPEEESFKFPNVEGFAREKVRRYEDPRLGCSVDYLSEDGILVTLYVYPASSPDLPGHLEECCGGIEEQARREQCRAEKGERGEVALGTGEGAPKVLRATYHLSPPPSVTGPEVVSDLYLAVHKGQYVKTRVTRSAGKEACEASVRRFLDALGRALSR